MMLFAFSILTYKRNFMNKIQVGDVLYRRKLLVQHAGVMLENGMVLHNSPTNGVEICTFEQYSEGKEVKVISSELSFIEQKNFKLRAFELIEQARNYKLFDFNCEHLVTLVNNAKPSSTQLTAGFTGAAAGLIFAQKSKNPLLTVGLFAIGGVLFSNATRKYDFTIN